MTKEQAIEVLNTYYRGEDNDDREFCSAIDMAIKALEQQPSEDCVSREPKRRVDMTLDEAIKHAEEVAEEQEKAAKEWHENQVRKCELIRFTEMDYTHENECKKCAKEHRQLAEWLKDYKRLLEQQPSDDCVRRQAVLEQARDYGSETFLIPVNSVKALPPVTPTRKVGKWIRKPIRNDKGGCVGAEMICFCCNKDNRHDEYMDFCPNCGAEMRGSENG